MAIARCDQHRPKPKATKRSYSTDTPHKPVGYPDTAIICGRGPCEKPALIWLEKEDEEPQYRSGRRIFDLVTNPAKVRLL
jgi:hypothetical protein